MELLSRIGEEPGQVVQALQVPQARGAALEYDRPEVALSPEDVCLAGALSGSGRRHRPLAAGLRRSGGA